MDPGSCNSRDQGGRAPIACIVRPRSVLARRPWLGFHRGVASWRNSPPEAPRQNSHTGDDERKRKDHSHRQPPPEVSELRIGLAKEFAENARRAVKNRKHAGEDSRTAQSAHLREDIKDDERQKPFEQGFVIWLGWRGRPSVPGKITAQGTSVGRPQSSGRMKLAIRPRKIPIGATSEHRSSTVNAGALWRRQNRRMPISAPISPP